MKKNNSTHSADKLPALTLSRWGFFHSVSLTRPTFHCSCFCSLCPLPSFSNDSLYSLELQLLSHTSSLEIHYILMCITPNYILHSYGVPIAKKNGVSVKTILQEHRHSVFLNQLSWAHKPRRQKDIFPHLLGTLCHRSVVSQLLVGPYHKPKIKRLTRGESPMTKLYQSLNKVRRTIFVSKM